MKTLCLLFALLCIVQASHAQVWEWAKAEPNDVVGNSSDDYDDAHHSAVDASGNLYVLGDYNDSLYLNGSYRAKGVGSYLAKYSPQGALLWSLLITSGDDLHGAALNATGLTVNKNGIFITGILPQPSYPFTYSIGSSSFLVDSGGYSGPSGYLYGSQFFLCRVNTNGSVAWNKTSRYAWVNSSLSKPLLSSDKSNNIYVSGIVYRQNCCGDFQKNKTFYLGSDAITDSYDSLHNYRLFSLKYNSSGGLLRSSFAHTKGYRISDPDYFEVLSSVTDNANNLWLYTKLYNGAKFGNITFSTNNTAVGDNAVFAICKLNTAGNWTVVKEVNTYASFIQNKNQAIATDASNNVYVLANMYRNYGNGYLNGNILLPYSTESPDMFLMKYNSSGKFLWYKNFGTTYSDLASSITYANGYLYLSGGVQKTPKNKFGTLTVPGAMCNSAHEAGSQFIAKADTSGAFIWVNLLCAFIGGNALSSAVYNDNVYIAGTHGGGILNLGSLTTGRMDGFAAPLSGKIRDQYIKIGAVTPLQSCAGGIVTIPFTSYGLTLSSANKLYAELGDSTGDFSNPIVIGSVTSTGTGSIPALLPAGLPYNSTYKIRIRSTDTFATGYNYMAYADTGYNLVIKCPVPAGLTTTGITSNTATLQWNSVSCAAQYRVQTKLKGAATWQTAIAPASSASYTATGLSPNTDYQWRMATVCQTSPQVVSSYSTIKDFKTAPAFTAKQADIIAGKSYETTGYKLYPNPAANATTLIVSRLPNSLTLQLTDVSGRPVWQKNNVKSQSITIPLGNLASGTYLLVIKEDTATKTVKLVKK